MKKWILVLVALLLLPQLSVAGVYESCEVYGNCRPTATTTSISNNSSSGNSSQWSTYPAVSNVNMADYNINNVSNITFNHDYDYAHFGVGSGAWPYEMSIYGEGGAGVIKIDSPAGADPDFEAPTIEFDTSPLIGGGGYYVPAIRFANILGTGVISHILVVKDITGNSLPGEIRVASGDWPTSDKYLKLIYESDIGKIIGYDSSGSIPIQIQDEDTDFTDVKGNLNATGKICDSVGCIGASSGTYNATYDATSKDVTANRSAWFAQDGTGGWVNTSTETNASVNVNMNRNAYFNGSISTAAESQVRFNAGSDYLVINRSTGNTPQLYSNDFIYMTAQGIGAGYFSGNGFNAFDSQGFALGSSSWGSGQMGVIRDRYTTQTNGTSTWRWRTTYLGTADKNYSSTISGTNMFVLGESSNYTCNSLWPNNAIFYYPRLRFIPAGCEKNVWADIGHTNDTLMVVTNKGNITLDTWDAAGKIVLNDSVVLNNITAKATTATSMYVCWDTNGVLFVNETGC